MRQRVLHSLVNGDHSRQTSTTNTQRTLPLTVVQVASGETRPAATPPLATSGGRLIWARPLLSIRLIYTIGQTAARTGSTVLTSSSAAPPILPRRMFRSAGIRLAEKCRSQRLAAATARSDGSSLFTTPRKGRTPSISRSVRWRHTGYPPKTCL